LRAGRGTEEDLTFSSRDRGEKGLYGRRRHLGGLENLKNVINLVEEFEKEIREKEVQQAEKRKEKQKAIEVELNPEAEEFKRSKLLGKYTIRILFG